MVAGIMDILNGLWALDAQDSRVDAIFWIFSYPVASILLVTLNLIVVYALTTYGLEETYD